MALFIVLAQYMAVAVSRADWQSASAVDIPPNVKRATHSTAASSNVLPSMDTGQALGYPQDSGVMQQLINNAIAGSPQTVLGTSPEIQTQDYSQDNGAMQMLISGAIGQNAQTAPQDLPEIKAIAAALKRDSDDATVDAILNWVTTNIEFEPYNGLKRGARRTAIERAGNSLDTAALAGALLTAAIPNINVSYNFVSRYLTLDQAKNWLGVASDKVAQYLNSSGGLYVWTIGTQPVWDNAGYDGTTPATSTGIWFPHMIIRVQTTTRSIDADPSYKKYIYENGMSLDSYAGANFTTTIFNAFTNPTESLVGTTNVSTLTGNTNAKNLLRKYLDSYSSGYVTNILNNDDTRIHALDGRQASGGRRIDPGSSWQVPLNNYVTYEGVTWRNEIDAQFHDKLIVTVGKMPAQKFDLADDLGGRKLSVVFSKGIATLHIDDKPVSGAVESSSSGTSAKVSIAFQYVDGIVPTPTTPNALNTAKGPYVILYGFNHSLGMVKERMRYLANLPKSTGGTPSNEVISENLYILGLQYLNELNVINEVASGVLPVRISKLHLGGIIGNNQVPFTDLSAGLTLLGSRVNNLSDADARAICDRAFSAGLYWQSMLEHSIIEQLIITDAATEAQYLNKGVSTVKMIQNYVDTGQTIYLARTLSEWSALSGTTTTPLSGYSASMLKDLGDTTFANLVVTTTFTTGETATTTNIMIGACALLPKSYAQSYNNKYNGMGYYTLRHNSDGSGSGGMMLTGALGTTGGGSWAGDFSPNSYNYSSIVSVIISGGNSTSFAVGTNTNDLATTKQSFGGDPVDMSSGAFTIDATDLTLGQGAAPYGLAFTRRYSSLLRNSDPVGLGNGWTHDYDIRLMFRHVGDLDINRLTVADVAPIMVATKAIYDSIAFTPESALWYGPVSPPPGYFYATRTAKNWVVPALVACWLGDQFINSRAVMQMGTRNLVFNKMRNAYGYDIYTPPAGVSGTLTKSGSDYVMKFRKGLEFTFNGSDGYFRKITDYNNSMSGMGGSSLTAVYYQSPTRLKTITDAYKRTLEFAYDGNKLARVTDSAGRYVEYSQSSEEFKYADPEYQTTTYKRGDRGLIESIVDAEQRTTIENTYDQFDRVAYQRNVNTFNTGTMWAFNYAPGVTRHTDPKGNSSYYYFDAKGRRTTFINAINDRTDWEYDGIDRLVSVIAPKRKVSFTTERETTDYLYDKNHELVGVQDPQGRITTISPYDETDESLVATITSPGKLSTTTQYWPKFFLPKSITHPGGITETFDAYDEYGRLLLYHPASYASGKYIEYRYSPDYGGPAQTLTTTYNYPGGNAAIKDITTFDTIGNITSKTDRAGVKTTFFYNNRRQLIKTIVGDGLAISQTSIIEYNAAGDVEYTTDPRAFTTGYIYNSDKQLVYATDHYGNTLHNTYNERNLLEATTDPSGFTTNFKYDPAQRLISVTNALRNSSTAAYDSLGNKTSTTTPLGITTRTDFDDSRNFVTSVTVDDHPPISFEFDSDGRQTAMDNRRSTPSYPCTFSSSYFDVARKVITRTPEGRETTTISNERGLPETTILPSTRIITNTSFDDEGRVLTQVIKDPNGATLTTTMTYEAKTGRLLTVAETGKNPTTRAYDSLGRLATYSDGEGNTITYGYDSANNLTSIKYPGPAGSDYTVCYSYDANNRLSSVYDWNGRLTTYIYDSAGRLVQTNRANGTIRKQIFDAIGQLRMITETKRDGTLLWMRTLDIDADGRIVKMQTYPSQPATQAVNAADTAKYDRDNRLSEWNGSTGNVNHDPDGNMLYGPVARGNGFANYAYDAHNHLTHVNGQQLYRYNADGLCVQQDGSSYVVDPNASPSRILKRNSTYYVWGANGLEYEINGNDTTTYHADHLGSTMFLTAANGSVAGDYFEYDSYGTQTHGPTTNTTPFRWHGTLGVITSDNGLHNMRARFYHSRLMRFVSSDPLGFGGGMNHYAFVNGNPLSNVDPLGLCADGGIQDNDYDSFFRNHGRPPNDLEYVLMVGKANGDWAAVDTFRKGGEFIGEWAPLAGGAGPVAEQTAVKGVPLLTRILSKIFSREGGAIAENAAARAESIVPRIQNVAQRAFDYAVENPRASGLNRMQLGKDAEVQASRWLRKWAARNGVDGVEMQVRGARSIPDILYRPKLQIFDFKLTPKAVRPVQTWNFMKDFPGYKIDYIYGPGPWRY